MNITGMRWVGQVAHMQEVKNAYKALVRKYKEKTLRRSMHRWKGNTESLLEK
jgi:hypothetical protein